MTTGPGGVTSPRAGPPTSSSWTAIRSSPDVALYEVAAALVFVDGDLGYEGE